MAAGGGPHPVVIFSHGLGGCRNTYSVFCAELASQVDQAVNYQAINVMNNSKYLAFKARNLLPMRSMVREKQPYVLLLLYTWARGSQSVGASHFNPSLLLPPVISRLNRM